MESLHEHFGLAIKNARLDCGLTQEALAERAGISYRYLIAIENEGRIPKLPTVYRLIHSLHIFRRPYLLSQTAAGGFRACAAYSHAGILL